MKTVSKIRNASSARKSTATRIAGRMSGSVMRKKRWNALAPSTFAASSSSSGTSARPASRRRPMNGVVFHTSVAMITTNESARLENGSVLAPKMWTKPVPVLTADFHAHAACPARAAPRCEPPVAPRSPSEELSLLGLVELALHVSDRRRGADAPLWVQRLLNRLRDVAVEGGHRPGNAVRELGLEDVRERE